MRYLCRQDSYTAGQRSIQARTASPDRTLFSTNRSRIRAANIRRQKHRNEECRAASPGTCRRRPNQWFGHCRRAATRMDLPFSSDRSWIDPCGGLAAAGWQNTIRSPPPAEWLPRPAGTKKARDAAPLALTRQSLSQPELAGVARSAVSMRLAECESGPFHPCRRKKNTLPAFCEDG